MNNQNLINYINGVIFGIKTSIKLFTSLKNNKKAIAELCKAQNTLKTRKFKSNVELWKYFQFEVLKNFWKL